MEDVFQLSSSDMKRLEALRTKLYAGIKAHLAEDPHCKSYEGRWTLSVVWPSYFERDEDPTFSLHLDCYVIGPHRHYDWDGDSVESCIAAAERSVERWMKPNYPGYDS